MALLSMLAYWGFRLYALIYAQIHTFSGGQLALAWVFLTAEVITFLTNSLPYGLRVMAWRQVRRPPRRLQGDDVPTVDVLVTCCGEDIDVILDTVRAACASDYPQDRFRVFACDDGRSEEVFRSIAALQATYPNVFYASRPKPEVPDFKSGNLNNGIRYSRALPWAQAHTLLSAAHGTSAEAARDKVSSSESTSMSGEGLQEKVPVSSTKPTARTLGDLPSEFVAGLDADMICLPHWLRAQMPYLIEDVKLAMTCPPQTFYDTPTNDPLTQNMLQIAGLTEVVNDSLGHADCMGSGYVMRRSALEAIGGFPVESLAEDVCCSDKLIGAGWKTCLIPEFLQYGSVPGSYYAHVKQRTRWFVGHVQTAFFFRFRTSNKLAGMGFRQKLTGLVFDLRQFMQLLQAANFVLIPLSLYAGYPLVIWSTEAQLVWLIRLVCIWSACHWIHQAIMGLVAATRLGYYDIRIASYDSELEQWLGPYICSAFVRSFMLPKRLGGQVAGFKSSGAMGDALAERDKDNRASLWRRSCDILWHQRGLVHTVWIPVCLGGVALTCVRSVYPNIPSAYTLSQKTYGNQLIYLIVRIGWPPTAWLQYVHASLVPILYVLFPPSVKPRDELLVEDPKTGARYPKPEAVQPPRDAWGLWRYIRPTLVILYTVFLFAISFFLFDSTIPSNQKTAPG
ncbi:hypothetical protein LTR22_025880 [Elasticomyces elasticus]|nr:hypothetical protein LTR22_025880 [Elasticomyces elasticus]